MCNLSYKATVGVIKLPCSYSKSHCKLPTTEFHVEKRLDYTELVKLIEAHAN